MPFPEYRIEINKVNADPRNISIRIDMFHSELNALLPIISKRIEDLEQELHDEHLKHRIEYIIDSIINDLIGKDYIRFDGRWRFNPLTFVLMELRDHKTGNYPYESGYGLYKNISTMDKPMYDRDVLARCLLDEEGNLCSYLTDLEGAGRITYFKGMLVNKEFDEAVQRYEDELILNIARVPKGTKV